MLRARLDAARTRWRLASMLRGAIFSLVAALALLCGFELFRLYLDVTASSASLTALPQDMVSYLALSFAGFAAAFALATLLAFVRTPDIGTLARKADRVLALQERLSTALEVDASQPPSNGLGPVRAALLADAEDRAAAVDPRQIAKFDMPRTIWAVPGLIAAAVLLHLISPDAFGLARGAITGVERDRTGFSDEQSAQAAANLRRIAELVGKDAEERSDPYLRTIARGLERLSADVVSPRTDRRMLANALDRLLAHTRQAYGQASEAGNGQVRRDVLQQLEAALEDIAGTRPAEVATPRETDANAGKAVAAEKGQTGGRPAQPPERKARRAETPSEVATPVRQPTWDDVLKDLDDYDPVDPRIEKERAFADQQRRARAAAQSAGAAKDAGQGDGDRAGDGIRPLGNGGNAMTELAPGAEMLLPDQAATNGGHIRIELPPEVTLADVAPPTAGSGTEWRRAREQAVARAIPSVEGRKVVGRYFVRSPGGDGR